MKLMLPEARRYIVAYSGGLDSSVLLHCLLDSPYRDRLSALHVNHGLSPHARRWQQHCEQLCARHHLPLSCFTVTLEGASEEAARRARYRVFEDFLQPGDCLLMAHHRDDQAETVLLRLLRGSGPRGLSAIPRSRPLGRGRIERPLLDCSRAALTDYAHRHGLTWVDDESNDHTRYDRNFLRHEVLPLLLQRWPAAVAGMERSARACADGAALLREVAREDGEKLELRRERLGWSLALSLFSALSRERQHNFVRHWIEQNGLSLPEQAVIERLQPELLDAAADAQPRLRWAGGELRRFRRRLYLLPPQLSWTGRTLSWCPGQALPLPDGALFSGTVSGPGDFTLRYRCGGERCRPAGRAHSQTLKKLLQEYGLEPWLRDRVPLLYRGEQLVAVGDLWVCDGERGSLQWRYPGEA